MVLVQIQMQLQFADPKTMICRCSVNKFSVYVTLSGEADAEGVCQIDLLYNFLSSCDYFCLSFCLSDQTAFNGDFLFVDLCFVFC